MSISSVKTRSPVLGQSDVGAFQKITKREGGELENHLCSESRELSRRTQIKVFFASLPLLPACSHHLFSALPRHRGLTLKAQQTGRWEGFIQRTQHFSYWKVNVIKHVWNLQYSTGVGIRTFPVITLGLPDMTWNDLGYTWSFPRVFQRNWNEP